MREGTRNEMVNASSILIFITFEFFLVDFISDKQFDEYLIIKLNQQDIFFFDFIQNRRKRESFILSTNRQVYLIFRFN